MINKKRYVKGSNKKPSQKTLHWKPSNLFCPSAGGSNKPCFLKLNLIQIKASIFFCFCRDFSTSVNNIQINKTKPQWHNYFLCGLKGIQVSQIHLIHEINVEVKHNKNTYLPSNVSLHSIAFLTYSLSCMLFLC